jgi:hypothetical protein
MEWIAWFAPSAALVVVLVVPALVVAKGPQPVQVRARRHR